MQDLEPCRWCGRPVSEQPDRPADYCHHEDLTEALNDAKGG